nr:ABC transporter transmembrane domain-containing protein [Victivallales bacterium]
MSKKIKNQSYIRLLKYVKPYKMKLAAGIIAGFVAGGSLFGSFFWVKDLIEPFEKTSTNLTGNISTEATVEMRKTAQPENSQAQKTVGKNLKELASIEKYAKKWNIPLQHENGKMTWQFFTLTIFGLIVLWLFKNLATYMNRYYTRWVGTKVVADLRDEVFGKLLNQSLKYYGNMDVGQLISRCTNDTAQIESSIAHTIADATRCPIEILACVGFLVYTSIINQNGTLLIILIIGLPASLLPIILIGKKIRKTYRKSFSKIADVVSRMHEVFTGILIVKAYNMEDVENSRFKDINKSYFKTVVKALKLELAMTPLMEFVAVLVSIAFWIFCYAQGLKISEIFVLVAPAIM